MEELSAEDQLIEDIEILLDKWWVDGNPAISHKAYNELYSALRRYRIKTYALGDDNEVRES